MLRFKAGDRRLTRLPESNLSGFQWWKLHCCLFVKAGLLVFLSIRSTEFSLLHGRLEDYALRSPELRFLHLVVHEMKTADLRELRTKPQTLTRKNEMHIFYQKEAGTHRINVHKCLMMFLVWMHAFYGRNKLLICLVEVWEGQNNRCTCVLRKTEINAVVLKSLK